MGLWCGWRATVLSAWPAGPRPSPCQVCDVCPAKHLRPLRRWRVVGASRSGSPSTFSSPVCECSRFPAICSTGSPALTGEVRSTARSSIATSGLRSPFGDSAPCTSLAAPVHLSEPEADIRVSRSDRWLGWLRSAALVLSFALLLLVAAAGPSAAKPGLGPRGWAPGDLPITLSSAVVTAVLWTAYLLGAFAVALGLWRGVGGERCPPRVHPWLWPVALGVIALLTATIGSADHTNYAAYGRIAAQGGDPYLVAPSTWAGGLDPVTSAVEPPWTMTPSVYGPFGKALQA